MWFVEIIALLQNVMTTEERMCEKVAGSVRVCVCVCASVGGCVRDGNAQRIHMEEFHFSANLFTYLVDMISLLPSIFCCCWLSA